MHSRFRLSFLPYPVFSSAVLCGLSADREDPSSPTTVIVQNQPAARLRRSVNFLLISTISFLVGGYLSLSYAPPILLPWVLGTKVVTDEESLRIYEAPDVFSREVDTHIKTCALAQELRAKPDFIESRPHLKIPEPVRAHSLTGGTLAGPGMIVVPPYQWNQKDGESMVSIMYIGPDVSLDTLGWCMEGCWRR